MPFESKFAALNAGPEPCARRFRLGQAQRQALRRAARFHEFTQWRFEYVEAGVSQARSQLGADLVQEEILADIYRVAGESHRVGLTHGNSLIQQNPLLDQTIGVGVESLRIVEQPSAFQGTEAGVEMIKAGIDQA